MFISTTAVFLAELVKLVTCLGLVWNSEERNVGRWSFDPIFFETNPNLANFRWWNSLHSTIVKQPLDTVKVVDFVKCS